MQAFKKKGVLSRERLLAAAVVLAVIGAVASYVQLAAEGSASAGVLTATTDSFVLVRVATAMNFSEANAFCEAEYDSHLAVVEDAAANQRFKTALAHFSAPAWIGYADMDNAEDFNWVDASTHAYTNWDAREPTDLCVQMLAASGKWEDVDCKETNNAFFCEVVDFTVVSTPKSWDDANAHCASAFGTQLVTVNDAAEDARIRAALAGVKAWIGLNDKTLEGTYVWADGSASAYRHWSTGQPDNAGGTEDCVQYWPVGWNDNVCTRTFPFVCSKPKAKQIVRLDNLEVHELVTAKTSAEARAYCQSQGADLYSIVDAADNARIQTALKAAAVDFAWIGLETAAATYKWKDGRALGFNNWAAANPAENRFSQMRASDGKWMTACAGSKRLGVVCTA